MQSNTPYYQERLRFFNIEEPFTISIDEFEIKWKTVDNIWVQVGTTSKLKKDPSGWTKTYDCRFKKRHKSSTKDPNVPAEKRRRTKQRHSDLCDAQITITRKKGIMTIRKTHVGGPNHSHDLKAIDIIKAPSILADFIEIEAKKGYRASSIKEAAVKEFKEKGVGVEYLQAEKILNIQHKVIRLLNIPY